MRSLNFTPISSASLRRSRSSEQRVEEFCGQTRSSCRGVPSDVVSYQCRVCTGVQERGDSSRISTISDGGHWALEVNHHDPSPLPIHNSVAESELFQPLAPRRYSTTAASGVLFAAGPAKFTRSQYRTFDLQSLPGSLNYGSFDRVRYMSVC